MEENDVRKSSIIKDILGEVTRKENTIAFMEGFLGKVENEDYRITDVAMSGMSERGDSFQHSLIIPKDLKDTFLTLVKAHYRKRIDELKRELDSVEIKIGGK